MGRDPQNPLIPLVLGAALIAAILSAVGGLSVGTRIYYNSQGIGNQMPGSFATDLLTAVPAAAAAVFLFGYRRRLRRIDDGKSAFGPHAGRTAAQPRRRDDQREPTPFRFRITRAQEIHARRILLEGADLKGEIRIGDGVVIPVKAGEDYRGIVEGLDHYNHVLAALSADADPVPFYVMVAGVRDCNNIRHDIASGRNPA